MQPEFCYIYRITQQNIFFENLNLQCKKIQKFRSRYRRGSVKKDVLKNLAKFTVKHLCLSLFATLLKKKLWHRCFLVNFAKVLRTPFFQNTSRQLLFKVPYISWKTDWRLFTQEMHFSWKSIGSFRIIKTICSIFDSEIEKSHIDIFDTTLKDFFCNAS